jgi:hypothetical protein
VTLLPLAVLCVGLGVYPKPLMQVLEPSVNDHVQLASRARAELRELKGLPPEGGAMNLSNQFGRGGAEGGAGEGEKKQAEPAKSTGDFTETGK